MIDEIDTSIDEVPILLAKRIPPLIVHSLLVHDEEVVEIKARQIGFASSHLSEHMSHLECDGKLKYAPKGERCSACRWFEVRIFRVENEYVDKCTCVVDANDGHVDSCGEIPARDDYLVLTYGISLVPNEHQMRREVWTSSPFKVLAVLTQRRAGMAPFLPVVSNEVLAEAAAYDAGIQHAYQTRRVL